MIKYILVSTFFLIAVPLAACTTGSPNEEASAGQVEEATPFVENDVLSQEETAQRELPDSTQLILGTFKLEQTDRKIDQAQAAALLPLWKAYRALLNSDSAAREEMDAVLRQIRENMTPEQLEVIENAGNNPEDMFALLQELGVGMENLQEAEEAAEGVQFMGGGLPGSGSPDAGFPGAAGPGSGQGPGAPPGGNLTPGQRESLQAGRAGTTGVGTRFGTMLIDPLIQLLETRSAG